MNPTSSPTALLALVCFVGGAVNSALIISDNEGDLSGESPEPTSKRPQHPFTFDGGDALEDARKDAEDGLDRFNVNSEREGARGESQMLKRVERSASAAAEPSVYLKMGALPKFFATPRAPVAGGAYGSSVGYYSQQRGSRVAPRKEGGLNAFHTSLSKTGSIAAAAQPAMQPPDYGYWSSGANGFSDAQPELPMQVWPAALSGYGPEVSAPPSLSSPQQPQQQAVAVPYPSGYGVASPYAGYLEKQINSYPIMIYTLADCIPCQRAKHLLALHYPDVRAHFLELSGNEPWQTQLQIDLQYLTTAATFPYIFVCGQYIGGSSDLFELHENGQLRRMVSQCLKTALPK